MYYYSRSNMGTQYWYCKKSGIVAKSCEDGKHVVVIKSNGVSGLMLNDTWFQEYISDSRRAVTPSTVEVFNHMKHIYDNNWRFFQFMVTTHKHEAGVNENLTALGNFIASAKF